MPEPAGTSARSKQHPELWEIELRDYFAAAALPAILSSKRWAAHPEVSLNDATHAAAFAAYALADALLKVREGR